jgi:hypothetical protein
VLLPLVGSLAEIVGFTVDQQDELALINKL